MEPLPPGSEQAVVGDVLDDGVLEAVLRLGKDAGLVNQLQALEGLDVGGDRRRSIGESGEQAHAELAADHRGRLDGALDRLPEAIDAGPDDVLHRVGKRPVSLAAPRSAGALGTEQAALRQRTGHFLDEERIAPRPVLDELLQARREWAGSRQAPTPWPRSPRW